MVLNTTKIIWKAETQKIKILKVADPLKVGIDKQILPDSKFEIEFHSLVLILLFES